MISIKRLLDADRDGSGVAFVRMASLLLEAIAVHAVNHDPAEFTEFRDTVRRIRLQIEQAESSGHAILITGEAVHKLEQYNRGVEKYIRDHGDEFHQMLRMLSRTVLDVSHAGDSAVANLRQVEKQIEAASRLEDLAMVRAKLGASLRALTEESARQQAHAERIAERLKGEMHSICSRSERRLDPVTGLPDAAAARAEIAAVIEGGAGATPGYAVVFRLDRLEAINTRFGFAVGDRTMASFTQHVATQLSSEDRLHRWRGPSLVAVIRRPGRPHDVRIEMSRIASTRKEETFEIQNRSVLLSMSCSSATIPLAEHRSAEEATQLIDGFLGDRPAGATG